ncbi:MAG TPA: AarF/UbiB family protein [Microthrixaceae bacterium]|nr:AarF/UbiB family protein [Microthrixaceae bacterium]
MNPTKPFRGPLSDGPTPEMLVSVEPDLSRVGLSEVGRVVAVASVITWFVIRRCFTGLVGRLRGRMGTFSNSAANGIIDAFMHLGPTYVKLGQVIASSTGLFPEWIAHPARRCLDEAPTFPVELVRRTVTEDLGYPIETLFDSFDDVPLSAASIGQVHGCVLKDGRDAVVKVQRPNLREQMTMDLKVLYLLARVANRSKWGRSANVIGMVQDLSALTAKELNPVVEAWNQQRYRDNLWVFGDNSMVTAPEVYWDYCGPRIICMERVHGIPMDDFETIRERGIDGQLVLRRGAKSWAEAVMVHGPFHGDMHAGNIWILDDGRGCFLDFGIMGELDDGWRDVMRDIYYTCVFDKDFTRVAAAYRRVGVFPADMGTDEEIGAAIGAMVNPLINSGMASVSLGDLITSALMLMKEYGGTPPQELMLVAKQLLYIERYTKELAPDYAVISDPFLVKNIFPEAAKDLATDLGISYPD